LRQWTRFLRINIAQSASPRLTEFMKDGLRR
jgi:hypothetical protein